MQIKLLALATKLSWGFIGRLNPVLGGLLFLILAIFSYSPVAQAAPGINEQLNYQARLLNAAGAIVPDGTYNMEFKIYQDGHGCESSGSSPCGGTLKWTETRTGSNRVTVKNGYFSVQLGGVNAFGSSVDWNQDTLWLSINIGGTSGTPSWDGEMTPFRRLSAVPYALNAKQLGGLDASKFVQVAPSAVQVDSGTLSTIFLNKTGASGNILQLQKNGNDMFVVANSGSVGIGTGATTDGRLNVLANGSRGVFVTTTTAFGDTNNQAFYAMNAAGTSDVFLTARDTDALAGTTKNQPFYFVTNNMARFTIRGNGDMGIGTTDPGVKLDVAANANIFRLTGDGSGTSHAYMEFYSGGSAGGRYGYFGYASGATNDLTLMNQRNGNMIFGTNNVARVTIEADGDVNFANGISLNTLSSSPRIFALGTIIYQSNSASLQHRITNQAGTDLTGTLLQIDTNGSTLAAGSKLLNILGDANVNALTVLSSGNVGIGTANPQAKLQVNRGYIVQDWSDQTEDNAPEHHFYGRSGKWLMGIDVANTVKSRDFVVAGVLGDYSFDDGQTTNGSNVLTSPSQGGFAEVMEGSTISGAGIPGGTTVLDVTSATSLIMSNNATATASNVRVSVTQNRVFDTIYLKHRGARAPTIGMGVTPPDGSYRVQIASSDDEAAMGGLSIRVGPSQTGHALAVRDSGGSARLSVDKDFYLVGSHGLGSSVAIKADASFGRPLALAKNDGSIAYGWQYSGNNLAFRYFTGGLDIWTTTVDGNIGIGSSTANARLDVSESQAIALSDNASYAVNVLQNGSVLALGGDASYSYIQSFAGKPLQINNLGNNVIFNLNGGNVGVGVSPSYKLHVSGDINISSGNAYKINGTNICTSSGCTAASGSGSYIQNSTTQQTANFNIVSGSASAIGALIESPASATVAALVVRAGATPGAGGDLIQQWQTTGAVAVAAVSSNGSFLTYTSGGVNTSYIDGSTGFFRGSGITNLANTGVYLTHNGTNQLSAIQRDAGAVVLALKGASGQTADMLQVLNSSDTIMAKFTKDGYLGIGIGASAPSGALHVRSDNATTAQVIKAYIDGAQSVASTNQQFALFINPTYTAASGTLAFLTGSHSKPDNTSGGTVTTMWAGGFNPINSGSGTVGDMMGVNSQVQKTGTGAVTSAYGLFARIDNTNATGAITNAYGLYIDNSIETGTITNDYGVYQVDTGAFNFFGGDVGVGVSSPSANLHVSGSTSSRDLFRVTDATATAVDVFKIADEGAITLKNRTNSQFAFDVKNTSNVSMFTIDTTNSNVIIGEVAAGSASTVSLLFGDDCGATDKCVFISEQAGSDSDVMHLHGANGLVFSTGYTPVQHVVINGAGDLKVEDDTDAPTKSLRLRQSGTGLGLDAGAGTLTISTWSDAAYAATQYTQMIFYADASSPIELKRYTQVEPGNLTAAFDVVNGSSQATFRVDTTNNRVGINGISPGDTLDVNGTIRARTLAAASATTICRSGTNVLASCTSSIRYKQDVQDMAYGLETIQAMRPVSFNWKTDGKREIGFIAEEMAKVVPEIITYDDGQISGLNYHLLTAILARGIQQQQVQIDQLRNAVWNGGVVAKDSTFNGSVTFNSRVTFTSDATFEGNVLFNKDTAGSVTIPANQREAKVTFKNKLATVPVVNVTPQDFIEGNYRVKEVTDESFIIELSKNQTSQVRFNWSAIQTKKD